MQDGRQLVVNIYLGADGIPESACKLLSVIAKNNYNKAHLQITYSKIFRATSG